MAHYEHCDDCGHMLVAGIISKIEMGFGMYDVIIRPYDA